MFTPKQLQLKTRTRRTVRGQSIVVALLVLLLLGLTGALFVTIIARNLINARHANRVVTADQYASAGITYADAQLSSSVDGADWRPPLQLQLANPPTEARELARYNAAVIVDGLATVASSANDPDVEYLQAGYSRYNTGAGRFLIRVTYDPVNITPGPNGTASTVPPGKYLKIESIGREGVIDPIDPTTYTNNRSTDRTQAYMVAYKPIGITDYARFETNPDKRSDIANLGVASQFYANNTDGGIATPGVSDFNSTGTINSNGTTLPTIQEYPVLTTYGAADAYISGTLLQPNPDAGKLTTIGTGFVAGGGSIHSNMPVRFFGTNIIYLNNAGATAPLFQDTAEIGGDLLLDSYDQKATLNNSALDTTGSTPIGQQAALILNPTNLNDLRAKTGTDAATYITPSNDTGSGNGSVNPSFDTRGGIIRDGSMQNDAAGLPRGITRLEPPLMDAQDSASQMPRYRAIAMNSSPRDTLQSKTVTYPAGSAQYGYGKAIYINNPADIQPDSTSIGGGSTLTDEWLHGNSPNASATVKGNWNGLLYNPPGVNITLGQFIPPVTAGGTGSYGIRLIRSNGDHFNGSDSTSAALTNAGPEMDVAYADFDTDSPSQMDTTGVNADKDIIIYAEGNVRVRGILSPNEGTTANPSFVPRHITIVTNGTAYIEGNLLKGSPDSSISVLAHDYICVNTTQFLAGTNVENRTDGRQNPALPDQSNVLRLDADHSLLQEFNFGLVGVNTATDTAGVTYQNSKLALYISAGPAGTGSTTADINILDPANNSVLQTVPLVQTFSTFTHLTFDLSSDALTRLSTPTASNTFLNAFGTDVFQLSISKNNGQEDASGVSSLPTQDVALERAAILPMDIRIEAVLYAQTRSFFVIPGEWFNTNQADNLALYLSTNGTRPDADGRFPMYGQPIDLKITIDGTVSEAHPADIAAQTAWMQKWGWIPQYHGSLVSNDMTVTPTAAPESSGHPLVVGATAANMPSIGLQIIYNPQAGYPYNPTNKYYLRSDIFGRPLPFTPKLPVSTGLLYSGQSGEPPLLQ